MKKSLVVLAMAFALTGCSPAPGLDSNAAVAVSDICSSFDKLTTRAQVDGGAGGRIDVHITCAPRPGTQK